MYLRKSLVAYALALVATVGTKALAENLPDASYCKIKSTSIYPTTPMGQFFIGEDKPGHPYPPTKGVEKFTYFHKAEEREVYRVVLWKGQILDNNCKSYKAPGLKLNYVLDEYGNFFMFENKINKQIRHSSILAGGEVAGAGDIKVDESGKVLKIDSDSGHYAPPQKFFNNVIKELDLNGFNLNEITVVNPVEGEAQH